MGVLIPYNETIPTGGNSLTQNLNIHYQVCLLLLPAAPDTDMISSSLVIWLGCSHRPP